MQSSGWLHGSMTVRPYFAVAFYALPYEEACDEYISHVDVANR